MAAMAEDLLETITGALAPEPVADPDTVGAHTYGSLLQAYDETYSSMVTAAP